MLNFVTGGTGLLGSHIAEQLRLRGDVVRTLVRPGSDTRFLKSIGAKLCTGDLADKDPLDEAMRGVDAVFHCAAKVGDWGPRNAFQRDVLDATRNVLDASHRAGVRRVIAISSTSAYGHPKKGSGPVTEDSPLGLNPWLWDDYTLAKVEAERMIWSFQRQTGLPVTVIRPSWMYGPRDRTSMPRLAASLKQDRLRIVGDGHNRLNLIHAANVAQACLLAAANPEAVGQAYNITNDGVITQREFLSLLADALRLTRPTRHVSYRIAFGVSFLLEAAYRTIHSPRPPFITRYAVWLLGRDTYYSIEKAQRELGWKSKIGYTEGIRTTAEWFRANHERR